MKEWWEEGDRELEREDEWEMRKRRPEGGKGIDMERREMSAQL